MIDRLNQSVNPMVSPQNGAENRVLSSAKTLSFSENLDSALGEMKKRDKEKRLRDACTEMESLFVSRLFKEMRKNVQKNEWIHGGFAEEIFEDMLYDEYAMKVSKNSRLGLGEMLYKELSKNL